jgi:hypothetical protein
MRLLSPLLSNALSTLNSRGICAGQSGGQGRGRTADLPLFRRTLIPTELPDLAGALPGRAVLTGFEPATSTLTGWRALRAALQDHLYRPPPGEQCPQRDSNPCRRLERAVS